MKHEWRTTNCGDTLICLGCDVTYDCTCFIDRIECLIHGNPHYQLISLGERGGCSGIKYQQRKFCEQM